jgi:hypothetical protein
MRTLIGFVLAGLAAGCASGPPSLALENKTFYQYDDQAGGSPLDRVERPYPALDWQGTAGAYVGVSILGGAARLSRPRSWHIRRASLIAEHRFIEYVSPHAYLVAIYERTDSPEESWLDILSRYEGDAKRQGIELLGQRIPIATHTTQGREYLVRRTVHGQRAAFVNTSREILLRSAKRVALVQFVDDGGDAHDLIATELLRVLDTLEIQ